MHVQAYAYVVPVSSVRKNWASIVLSSVISVTYRWIVWG